MGRYPHGPHRSGSKPIGDRPKKPISMKLDQNCIEALAAIATAEGKTKTEIIESLIKSRHAEFLAAK